MKIGAQIEFPREKWRKTKEGKKQKANSSKKSGRILPTIIQAQSVPKIGKIYIFSTFFTF